MCTNFQLLQQWHSYGEFGHPILLNQTLGDTTPLIYNLFVENIDYPWKLICSSYSVSKNVGLDQIRRKKFCLWLK